MKVKVFTKDFQEGAEVIKLNDAFWGQDFNQALVHEAVVAYMANGRQGSKKNKTRSEVRGGKAKPWAQKGTGNARAGGRTMPHWRGGGVAFAAGEQNYSKKINRKAYRKAMKVSLSELLRRERLVVLEEFGVAEPKTKQMLAIMGKYAHTKTLLVDTEIQQDVYLAARNIPLVAMLEVEDLRIIDLAHFEYIIMTKAALARLEEIYTDD